MEMLVTKGPDDGDIMRRRRSWVARRSSALAAIWCCYTANMATQFRFDVRVEFKQVDEVFVATSRDFPMFIAGPDAAEVRRRVASAVEAEREWLSGLSSTEVEEFLSERGIEYHVDEDGEALPRRMTVPVVVSA